MNEKQIVNLLKRYKHGTLNDDEKSKLETWYLDEAGAERKKLTESEIEEISNQIRSRLPVPNKLPVVRRLWARGAAAAIALIVCGISIYVSLDNHNRPISKLQDTSIITPGGHKATLTLADGTKINLSDATIGQISNQSGIRIVKAGDGQVLYDVSRALATGNTESELNTIEVPMGGQWKVKLSDGSFVFLNAMSSITYPTKFIGDERMVQITGEAYFEIAHNKKPFKVESKGQLIEVYGTHFNVMAYDNEKSVKTTLLEGSVKVVNLTTNISHFLKPGEQAQIEGGDIRMIQNVDLEDAVAWKNGYFKFNEDLQSIMSKVARWYNVEVDYQEGVDKSKKFAGKISRSKDISSTLRIMELTEKIHFKIEGRRIIVLK